MLIYKVINQVNGKVYIGQTQCTLEKRKGQHYYCANYNTDSYYFHNALKKYDEGDFVWQIVNEAHDIDTLNQLEKHYIKCNQSNDREHGYNSTSGGDRTDYTDETRKKISESRKGIKFSDEHRANLSKANTGKKQSPETIAKRVAKLRGQKRSDEFKEACRQRALGKPCAEKTKKILREQRKGIPLKGKHRENVIRNNKENPPRLGTGKGGK